MRQLRKQTRKAAPKLKAVKAAPWDLGYQAPDPAEMNKRSLSAYQSNQAGRLHEKMIEEGAKYYMGMKMARVTKMPEPFRVVKKWNGRAEVQFIRRAEPDFVGCIDGGRLIAFEAKYTDKDRMEQGRLTETQAMALEEYDKLSAKVFVCAWIKDKVYMIPWYVWKRMDMLYGRKYVTQDDLKPYQVKMNQSCIFFLHYIKR